MPKKQWDCTKRCLNADWALTGEDLNADSDLRCKIAKEAATLLYFGAEKEYKQAKVKAAKTLGAHFLPTNLEVAVELDKIAEAQEGPAEAEADEKAEERLISPDAQGKPADPEAEKNGKG